LRLLRTARGQWLSLVWVFILSVIAAGLAALQPWPMKLIVDHVLDTEPLPPALQNFFQTLSLAQSDTAGLLAAAVLGSLALFLLNSAVDAVLAWKCTVVGRRMTYDLAEELFARLQRRSLLFHTRNPVGDVMGRITVDSWCGYQIVDALVLACAHALLTMAAMIFLMAQ